MTKALTPLASPRPRRRIALGLTSMLLPAMATVVVAMGASEPSTSRAGAVTAVAAGSASGDSSPQPVPAREHLLRLAGSITALPDEAATGFAHHHLRRWILDTTGKPDKAGPTRPPGWRHNTPAVFAVDIRRSEAADRSGRGTDVENPPDYTLTGARPGYRSTDGEFASGTTKRTAYSAGNQRSPISAPLATEPAALAAQLAAVDPMPDGPQAILRAVDELYAAHYVEMPVRRAALQVLANLDGLRLTPGVTDRLGRTGDAVTLTAAGVEYTLVFDPTTGRLLASQQRSTDAHEYLAVPPGLVRYYTLYIEQARRPTRS
jgi:hypothetical protein